MRYHAAYDTEGRLVRSGPTSPSDPHDTDGKHSLAAGGTIRHSGANLDGAVGDPPGSQYAEAHVGRGQDASVVQSTGGSPGEAPSGGPLGDTRVRDARGGAAAPGSYGGYDGDVEDGEEEGEEKWEEEVEEEGEEDWTTSSEDDSEDDESEEEKSEEEKSDEEEEWSDDSKDGSESDAEEFRQKLEHDIFSQIRNAPRKRAR